MKSACSFLPLLLAANTLFAQQSVLRGEASIINSMYETKARQYVANAQVEEDFDRAQPAITDASGLFHLIMVGVQEKESITFSVNKEGLEVVNTDALSAVAGQKEVVKIYMATPQKIAEYKRQYYQIGKSAAEKSLKEKLKKLQTERQALLADNTTDKNRIADLETQLGHLEARRSKIDEEARDLARRYAPINLDDASPLYQEAFSWFQKGELDEALDILRKANLARQAKNILVERDKISTAQLELLLRDSIQKQRTSDVLTALSFKADLHRSRFEFDSASVCFELMLMLDSTDYGNIFKFARFLAEQNQPYRAINLFEKCFSLAKTDAQQSGVLNNLGVLYNNNQMMPEAEKVFNKALNTYRKLSGKNPNTFLGYLATTLNNLGKFYVDNQKMPEAEKAYNEASAIYRKLAQQNPDTYLPEVAMIMNNLGVYAQMNQKMPEAEKAYKEALSIYRTLAEKNPNVFLQDVAMTLNNLGEFYRVNQKMPEAEKAYYEARDLYRNLAEQNPQAFQPNVAMTLNNLGIYYRANQKMPEAEKSYNEALGIYRKLAEQNPDAFLFYLAGTLGNLGNFYREDQKMPESEKSHNEALSIYLKLVEKNPDAFLPYLATTHNNLGSFYYDNQKMPEAEKAFLDALSIERKMVKQNPEASLREMARTLYNLGVFYRELKQYARALDYSEEALSIFQKSLLTGNRHLFKDWVQVFSNISDVKDSVEVKKQYTLTVRAGYLLATTFDSLGYLASVISKEAVSQYGSLSWWAVFAKNYTLAEQAGLRCLALDETQIYVWTNIGHARWLSGKESSAKTAWLHLKGKNDGSNRPYSMVLQADWQALESAGVVSPAAFDAARKWLDKQW